MISRSFARDRACPKATTTDGAWGRPPWSVLGFRHTIGTLSRRLGSNKDRLWLSRHDGVVALSASSSVGLEKLSFLAKPTLGVRRVQLHDLGPKSQCQLVFLTTGSTKVPRRLSRSYMIIDNSLMVLDLCRRKQWWLRWAGCCPVGIEDWVAQRLGRRGCNNN